MTAYDVPGLCQRTIDYAIDEHRTSAKGAYDKQVIMYGDVFTINDANKCYSDKRAKKSPEMLSRIN